jgi:hypothetical protein
MLGPLALLIVSFMHIISGQHIPEGIYKQWQGHCCHKAKDHFSMLQKNLFEHASTEHSLLLPF